MSYRLFAVALSLCVALVLLPGCVRDDYPADLEYQFTPYPSLNVSQGKDILIINPSMQADLGKMLKDYFGTPAKPIVNVEAAIQEDAEMQLQPETLKEGSTLYRKLCLMCHGLNGDATGPTAEFLNPLPRDFRHGLFKFRSTTAAVPSRADLKRTLRAGIPAASMPSFALLSDDNLDALISYVIHLSLRGQVERQIASAMNTDTEYDVDATVPETARAWMDGAKSTYSPKLPEGGWQKLHQEGVKTNWELGRKLYLGNGACGDCHGKGTWPSPLEAELRSTNEGRRDQWGDLNLPRNLTDGVYRGGSRPLDLFYRMKVGIVPSGMPAASLTDEEIWQVVDYVMSLPQRR